MDILVTGGAGFIGSHVVEALLENGHNVAVLDNLSNGFADRIPSDSVLYDLDICDPTISHVFRQFRPEIVVHLAAQTDVAASVARFSLDAQINIMGTLELLQKCAEFGIRKFIYASSAAVYGNPKSFYISEDHPLRPISPYGISKYAAELYVQRVAEEHGIDHTVLRYANVYGERQGEKSEGGVVSGFIRKLRNRERPIIFGTGEQTRDFIYVKDVAEANVAALTRGSGGTFNVGTGQRTSVLDLLRKLGEVTGIVPDPLYEPPRLGDILHNGLDIRLASEELGWAPRYSLIDGLKQTYDPYFIQSRI
ncbi:NAD-dependent epimerase/dehydratase family protein [Cohnella candidum]|uniref:NAD-dependent epimerase/dehydratase family protein n=1 Tax=Cohnella candidum TaxID=2674991 RepID=A0A3G3JT55_9BACL|nr:NAD-dependent epimerase/dehydratase family protein [Cohnella candidum]AYQ71382.1 NAD-dependent epimerase/dehydratase family protein [Cohnella candidum]